MLIGILADTHDNLPMIERALTELKARKVEVLLHAGDYVAPFALKRVLASELPLVGVFGNNDGERRGLGKLSEDIHLGPYRFELEGRTIVMAHEPDVLKDALGDGDDLGVCGHTHEPQISIGPPLVVNPGEVGGWLTGRSTGAVVDLKTMCAELLEFAGHERAKR
jgi:hypothetical protein